MFSIHVIIIDRIIHKLFSLKVIQRGVGGGRRCLWVDRVAQWSLVMAIILYPDCSGGYANPYMMQSHRTKFTYTITHWAHNTHSNNVSCYYPQDGQYRVLSISPASSYPVSPFLCSALTRTAPTLELLHVLSPLSPSFNTLTFPFGPSDLNASFASSGNCSLTSLTRSNIPLTSSWEAPHHLAVT